MANTHIEFKVTTKWILAEVYVWPKPGPCPPGSQCLSSDREDAVLWGEGSMLCIWHRECMLSILPPGFGFCGSA